MTDPTTASVLLAVARAQADVGRELEPALLQQVEQIATDESLAESLRRDALAIVEMERGAA